VAGGINYSHHGGIVLQRNLFVSSNDSHHGGIVLQRNLIVSPNDSHPGGAVSQQILNAELEIKPKLKHRISAPYQASDMIY
jgi:hypothetical protein